MTGAYQLFLQLFVLQLDFSFMKFSLFLKLSKKLRFCINLGLLLDPIRIKCMLMRVVVDLDLLNKTLDLLLLQLVLFVESFLVLLNLLISFIILVLFLVTIFSVTLCQIILLHLFLFITRCLEILRFLDQSRS